MITSEIGPYAKVGGLGDVVGALARELSYRGHDVRVLCPFYGSIEPRSDWFKHEKQLCVKLGTIRQEICEIWEGKLGERGGYLYFLKNDKYYGRKTIYNEGGDDGHQRNGEGFIVLSRGGIELCPYLNWIPDVIHCHDWMTGMVPVYIGTIDKGTEMGTVPTVLTIHNMQHQGIFGEQILEFAGLPKTLFVAEALEHKGYVNLLKGGLIYATKLTTVSERYAWEIIETEMGCGLNSICEARKKDLIGILNGIDVIEWNSERDFYLSNNYGLENLEGKKECKLYLQKLFNFKEDSNAVLFGAIARLYYQKGLDLLIESIPKLMEELPLQIVILGMGDHNLERELKNLAGRYKDRMGVHIGYDVKLAHMIEAGLDFFLMPSRFEPCGLNQMYSMTYGAVPIVRETGGLADTVIPYTIGSKNATGLVFREISEKALYDTIVEACAIFYERPKDYLKMQINGMKSDFSWEKSIKKYEAVYVSAVEQSHVAKKSI